MGALRWEVASQTWVGTDPRRSDLIQELDVLEAAIVKKKKKKKKKKVPSFYSYRIKYKWAFIRDNIQIVTSCQVKKKIILWVKF